MQSFETANLKHLRSTPSASCPARRRGRRRQGRQCRTRPALRSALRFRRRRGQADIQGPADRRRDSPRSRPMRMGLALEALHLSARQVDANGDGKPDDLNGDGKIDEHDRVLLEPTTVVKDAHAAGLFVHTWTFRSEPRRLASTSKAIPPPSTTSSPRSVLMAFSPIFPITPRRRYGRIEPLAPVGSGVTIAHNASGVAPITKVRLELQGKQNFVVTQRVNLAQGETISITSPTLAEETRSIDLMLILADGTVSLASIDQPEFRSGEVTYSFEHLQDPS